MLGHHWKPEKRQDPPDFLYRPGDQILVVDVAPIRSKASLADRRDDRDGSRKIFLAPRDAGRDDVEWIPDDMENPDRHFDVSPEIIDVLEAMLRELPRGARAFLVSDQRDA